MTRFEMSWLAWPCACSWCYLLDHKTMRSRVIFVEPNSAVRRMDDFTPSEGTANISFQQVQKEHFYRTPALYLVRFLSSSLHFSVQVWPKKVHFNRF